MDSLEHGRWWCDYKRGGHGSRGLSLACGIIVCVISWGFSQHLSLHTLWQAFACTALTALVLYVDRNRIECILGPPLLLHWHVAINMHVSADLLPQVFLTQTWPQGACHLLIVKSVSLLSLKFSPYSSQRQGAELPPKIRPEITVPDYARFHEPIWSLSAKISAKGKTTLERI